MARIEATGRKRETVARMLGWLLIVVALLGSIFAGFAERAGAATGEIDITIPIETEVDAEEETITVLVTRTVPAELIGQFCTVVADAENQSSVHPGNDLIISSGGGQLVLADVERESGGTTHAEGFLQLGEEIVISLLMGEDEYFSAGMSVLFTCTSEPPTTTTTTGDEVLPTEVTTTTAPPEESTTLPEEVLPTVITTTTAPAAATSTAVVTSTVGDEVEAVEELPFTGVDPVALTVVAVSLLCIGGVFVVEARAGGD